MMSLMTSIRRHQQNSKWTINTGDDVNVVSETKINCNVEFFGLSPEMTDLYDTEVEIKDGAGLPELIAALRRKVRTLEGQVIMPDKDMLQEGFAFNINGEFHFEDEDIHIGKWDRVVLILLSAGG
jgi:hypothetical protein